MSWSRRGRRRQAHLSRGGVKPFQPFRSQPYPGREERSDSCHETESFENVEQSNDYTDPTDYKQYKPSPQEPNVTSLRDGDKRSALYQRFYQYFHGDGAKQPADCVILALNNQKFVSTSMHTSNNQENMRAWESLKIHRNMPREQALDLVMVEYGRASGARQQCDPVEAAARASELSDDYLERAKLERHAVPSATRHLLLLMAEGLHLYPEELGSIASYVHNRQDHLQASAEVDGQVTPETTNSLPAGLGNPPPLLPTPFAPVSSPSEQLTLSAAIAKPAHVVPTSTTDSYPKTKPPPLLSLNILQGSPQGPPPHDPPPPRGPAGTQAPSTSRGHPQTRGPSAPETRPLLYGPPPLHGPSAPINSPPSPHGTPHCSSVSQNPQVLRGSTAPRRPPASHGTHAPRTHGPHNGPHGFNVRAPPPPHGPTMQNSPSGLRAPPPLLRNLRMRNPAGLP